LPFFTCSCAWQSNVLLESRRVRFLRPFARMSDRVIPKLDCPPQWLSCHGWGKAMMASTANTTGSRHLFMLLDCWEAALSLFAVTFLIFSWV
jgi:hypothetical protein